MNKLFLTLLSIASLNLSLVACQFPDLTSLEKALLETATAQGIDDLKTIKALDPDTFQAFIDKQTPEGESRLFRACWSRDAEGVKELIEVGASPFLAILKTGPFFTAGDTALNMACRKCPRSTVELLLRKGGHRLINTTNEHGQSCLHDLCREHIINVDTLRLILEHGGDANLQDKDGNTPFHVACCAKEDINAQKTALELLMQHSADTTILNNAGRKAYAVGLVFDVTNKRALDSSSKEAREIKLAEKRAATAAAAAVTPTLKQRALQILCSICMSDEEDKDAERHIVIACNHGYHRACLTPWLARNPSCPLCRSKDITEKK